MNEFAAGAQRVKTGWIAYYRKVHQSQNTVLRNGRHDIIFPTEIEALKAANEEFFKYLNSPITGVSSMGGTKYSVAKTAAEKIFMGGVKVVAVERRRMPA
ncbi:hypothetical protein G6L30_08115 [Agrobacterium rhizogenes]|nr:hypothetical protein [Rhizobium rhizogenes]